MTNEAAIERLEESRVYNNVVGRASCAEALGLAISALRAQPGLVAAMESIAEHTHPAPPQENYRADDREGCLDTVFALAKCALAATRPTPAKEER